MHTFRKTFIKKTCIFLTAGFTFTIGFSVDSNSLFPHLSSNVMKIKAVDTAVENKPLNTKPTELEVDKEAISVGKVLDVVFKDGYSQVAEAKKIESTDLSKSTYAIDSLIIETDLDFDKLGEQTGTLTVYDQGASNVNPTMILETNETEPIEKMDTNIKHNFTVEIEVKDTVAPEIHLTTSEILLDNGEEIVPEEWVDYIWDNADGEITSWEFDANDLDINSGGHYTGIYTATDSSGNTATEYLYIAVKEKQSVSRLATYNTTFAAYSAGANTSGSIYELANLINSYRASYGLGSLTMDTGSLGAAAQLRATEASGYVSHYRPNGTYFSTALDAYGVGYNTSGEVLTYAGTTPAAALNWWMSSPAHWASLMSGRYTSIGIGYYNGMWCGVLIG